MGEVIVVLNGDQSFSVLAVPDERWAVGSRPPTVVGSTKVYTTDGDEFVMAHFPPLDRLDEADLSVLDTMPDVALMLHVWPGMFPGVARAEGPA